MSGYEFEKSDYPSENGHLWAKVKSNNFLNGKHSCKNCGILRKIDGSNNPCKGKVKVTLR